MGVGNIKRRISRTGFTTMNNHCFKNKNISYKAKGMLAAMLSLPDGWGFSVAGLAGLSTDGEASVKSALAELKQQDYVRVYPKRDECGHIIAWCYDVCDEPIGDLPDVGNPDVENPHVENQPPYKVSNISSTNGINNDTYKEDNFSRTNSTSKNISSDSKENKKKGLDYSFVATEYIQAFGEWLEYKKKMGKMYKTQRGLRRAYNDLLKACENNPNFAMAVVNDCIDREYVGICLTLDLRKQLYGNNNQKARNPWCDVADVVTAAGGIL